MWSKETVSDQDTLLAGKSGYADNVIQCISARTVFVAMILVVAAMIPYKAIHADSVGHVSDLPWIHQSWPFGCSWHCDCGSGPDNSSCSGVDFNLRADTVVISAGNGSIVQSVDIAGGLGPQFVEVEHEGGIFTDYAHLNRRFWPQGSEESICRFVPLGYSGGSNGVDHLHFAGRSKKRGEDGSAQDNKNWPPVHADLASGVTLGNPPFTADGSPHSYGSSAFTSGNWMSPREHSGGTTSAYMVDNTQIDSEFFLHQDVSTPGGWNRQEAGFGYWGLTAPPGDPPDNAQPASSFTRKYRNTGALLATFDPILPTAGEWAVYVFVPSDGATTTSASYEVGVLDPVDGWIWAGPFEVNQNENVDKWVRLGGEQRFETVQPGQWKLSVRLFDRCKECGDDTRHVAADAALFIPADCS